MTGRSIFQRIADLEATVADLTRTVQRMADTMADLRRAGLVATPDDMAPNVRATDDPDWDQPGFARMRGILAPMLVRTGLTLEDLRSQRGSRHVVWPRQAAMLALHRAGLSMYAIGRFLHRDPTTVCHGIRVAEAREIAAGEVAA